MSRASRDRGGVGTSFVVTLLVALAGGGAAVAVTGALVTSQAPDLPTDTIAPAAGSVGDGPSEEILNYGE